MRTLLSTIIALLITTALHAETISVAAAISMKDALAKVAEQYTAETGDKVEFTLGASGQLMAQIQNGAPVDLFISAANKQVDELIKSGAAVAGSRKVIAGNALVLVVPATNQNQISIKTLTDAGITKIAVGEPKSVPAGQYAEQALKKADVYDSVKDKVLYAMNVRQVLDYVERGDVSAGFVYATDAKQSSDKVRIAEVIDPSTHDPIVYPAVVIAASKQQAAAEKFLNYLLSDSGQKTIATFGFTAPIK